MAYRYEERVVVATGEDGESSMPSQWSPGSGVRLETLMEWKADRRVHPFAKLVNLAMPKDEHWELIMSISSRAALQQHNQKHLSELAFLGMDNTTSTITTSKPYFSNGFALELIGNTGWNRQEITEYLLESWIDKRVITTPLQDALWDTYITSNKNNIQQNHDRIEVPNNGAAWSADALQQFFQAIVPPCYVDQRNTLYFGHSPMEWSQLLVDGHVYDKQLWFQLVRMPEGRIQARLGMQFFVHNHNTASPILTQSNKFWQTQPSCPLMTQPRHLLHLGETDENKAWITLEQVLRKPYPNQGRLETWLSIRALQPEDTASQCQMVLRQRLPSFVQPIWQTFQVENGPTSLTEYTQMDVDQQDGSSTWTVRLPASISGQDEQNIVVSLELEAALLSIDEFPGDPNRGQDLPPAMLTWDCPPSTPPPSMLYSNSVLWLPAVPDMSMPFNVLSLSCSLYAYLIGTLVTLLVKRASEKIRYQRHPHLKPKSKIQRVKDKIRSKLSRIFKKDGTAPKDSETNPNATTTEEEEEPQANSQDVVES